MKKLLNKKGFTIVELVIVIAVIGILAAVLIPTFSNVIDTANESAALQEAKNELNAYNSFMVSEGIILGDGTVFKVEKGSKNYTFVYYNSALLNVTDYSIYTAGEGAALPNAQIKKTSGATVTPNLDKFVKLSKDDSEKIKVNDTDTEVFSYLFFNDSADGEIEFTDGSDSCKIYAGGVYKILQTKVTDTTFGKSYVVQHTDYAILPANLNNNQ